MKKITSLVLASLSLGTLFNETKAQTNYNYEEIQKENLGRGLIAIRQSSIKVFLTWRYLSSDPTDIAFNVYKEGTFIRQTSRTSFIDVNGDRSIDVTYKLVPVIDGVEQTEMAREYTLPANSKTGYLEIPLDKPDPGVTPAGEQYTYSANDVSVGDVTGDGEFEIILKWDPSNSKDNSHTGYTGNVYFDCYKLNGEKLWRIDMGVNIRAGAHYTQFLVYDFDGDGKSEIIMKTADGTKDGVGNFVGNKNNDHRDDAGLILKGTQYLTVFNGETGAAMSSISYIPQLGDLNYWGDTYGNRSERYLACTAFLDGKKPSAVMCRGYYYGQSGKGPGRTVIAAWDWDGKKLTNKWTFDTQVSKWYDWRGQGYHSVRVADVDSDGCDEIIYGSMVVNNDGNGLYNTYLGHGDAHHLTVFDSSSDKLGLWSCHEDKVNGSTFRDAGTGEILFQVLSGDDVGRCMAADIDPTHKGVEMWSSRSGGIRNVKGEVVNSSNSGVSMNMGIWWDGTLLRNLQDGTAITKYNYKSGAATVSLNATGCVSNNGTKSTPCLIADMYGDWREEIILREEDDTKLRLYVNCKDSIAYKFHTFLEDPVYRSSVAYQNVGYNQPTNVGFYFGADLGTLMTSELTDNGWILDAGMKYDKYEWWYNGEIIGNERLLTVPIGELEGGTENTIILKSLFRGHYFQESAKANIPMSIKKDRDEDFYVTQSKDKLVLTFPSSFSGKTIEIFNMLGARVDSHIIPSGFINITIPTANFNKGAYILNITLPNKKISKKIIIT